MKLFRKILCKLGLHAWIETVPSKASWVCSRCGKMYYERYGTKL